MKSYGVNWFLVWIGLMVWMCPVCVWLQELLRYHMGDPTYPKTAGWIDVVIQAFSLSLGWTYVQHLAYDKTLNDPKAIERLRQSRQRNEAAHRRRYRWLVTWAIGFAVVFAVSAVCKLIFNSPSWLYVVGYSLLLPCCFVAFGWLTDKAAKHGQLERLLRANKEGSEEAP